MASEVHPALHSPSPAVERAKTPLPFFDLRRQRQERLAAPFALSLECASTEPVRQNDEGFVVLDQTTVSFSSSMRVALSTRWNEVFRSIIACVPVKMISEYRSRSRPGSHHPIYRITTPMTWMWPRPDFVVEVQPGNSNSSRRWSERMSDRFSHAVFRLCYSMPTSSPSEVAGLRTEAVGLGSLTRLPLLAACFTGVHPGILAQRKGVG